MVSISSKSEVFEFSGGGGGYIWPVMPIFQIGRATPVKSHVWKFGLDWLKLELCEFSGVAEAPY